MVRCEVRRKGDESYYRGEEMENGSPQSKLSKIPLRSALKRVRDSPHDSAAIFIPFPSLSLDTMVSFAPQTETISVVLGYASIVMWLGAQFP